MDVHDFPFDRQMLYIETQLRSITVDKSKLERGQKARLYVALEDAGSGIVNNKRHHVKNNKIGAELCGMKFVIFGVGEFRGVSRELKGQL